MYLNDEQVKTVLRGCRLNNREAQRKLYLGYFGYAMSVAFQHCFDYDIAVAITNDAFLKIYSELKVFVSRSDKSADSFKAWLGNSVFDACIKHKNKGCTQEITTGGDNDQGLFEEGYKTAVNKLPHKEAV
jgi:DNA-directed RNA polymerase specialized sigma24 family protein